jgi:hypothetical protein
MRFENICRLLKIWTSLHSSTFAIWTTMDSYVWHFHALREFTAKKNTPWVHCARPSVSSTTVGSKQTDAQVMPYWNPSLLSHMQISWPVTVSIKLCFRNLRIIFSFSYSGDARSYFDHVTWYPDKRFMIFCSLFRHTAWYHFKMWYDLLLHILSFYYCLITLEFDFTQFQQLKASLNKHGKFPHRTRD